MRANWPTFWGLLGGVAAVGPVLAQGIYTCVDGKGRTITSDRPIIECIDREQKELNPSGTVRRQVGPTLTAVEQAAAEEKAHKAALEQSRRNEEKRKARALLTRYPDRAAHDRVRAEALVQIDTQTKGANLQITELQAQRKKLDLELEFYKGDLSKAPAALKRQVEQNDASVATQKQFIAAQQAEKNRVNARFDDELARLKLMWPASSSATR